MRLNILRGTGWGVAFVAISCAAIPWIRSNLIPADPAGRRVAEIPRIAEPQPPVAPRKTRPIPNPPLLESAEVRDLGPFAVQINSTPWARVRVDGIDLGETPLADVPLIAGIHAFRAEMADGRVIEQAIGIDAESRFVAFE